ncbi:PE family protein [Mycobacterium sp.]|uniref:PE family protein n=1 Tax=Mycobacterium sp. TaxID=1785 RepID=UPI0025FAF1E5|nr:PE family protein [Mycobacterium sp.]
MTSFVNFSPDLMETASQDLASIRSSLGQATAAAAAPTTGLVPAAADEVSAAISQLFGSYGQDFQALTAQASAFHAQFVNLLNGSAASYLATEIANAQQGLAGGSASATSSAANAAASILPILGGGGGSGGGGLLGGLVGSGNGGALGGLGALFNAPALTLPSLPPVPSPPSFPGLPSFPGAPSFPGLPNLGNLLGGSGGGTGGFGAIFQDISTGLSNLPTGLQTVLGDLSNLLFPQPGAPSGPEQSPWVLLFTQSGANLQDIGATFGANPFPLLHRIAINQGGYMDLIGAAVYNGVTDFPGGLNVLPGQIEAAIASAQGFNPGAFLQYFGAKQGLYGQILTTSLANAGQDFQTTIPVFEQDAGEAYHQLTLGNFNTAVSDYAKASIDLFISGFDTSHLTAQLGTFILDPITNTIDISGGLGGPILLEGPAGALLPILAIPGDEVQIFADIMPAGSTAQHMAQNFSNIVHTLTDTTITTNADLNVTGTFLPPSITPSFVVAAGFGLPLQLGFAFLGAPFAGLNGLATAATQLGAAVQAGDGLAAVGAVANTPAFFLNGLLNGETTLNLAVPVSIGPLSVPLEMAVPLDGILVKPHGISATVSILGLSESIPISGAKFGGLLPLLINGIPEALANSIINT